MPKKKVKDLTLEEIKAICLKARTNEKGKVKVWCANENCPLYECNYVQLPFQNNMKICELVAKLNQEIEVEEDEQ